MFKLKINRKEGRSFIGKKFKYKYSRETEYIISGFCIKHGVEYMIYKTIINSEISESENLYNYDLFMNDVNNKLTVLYENKDKDNT
jgi:hypothetical protein